MIIAGFEAARHTVTLEWDRLASWGDVKITRPGPSEIIFDLGKFSLQHHHAPRNNRRGVLWGALLIGSLFAAAATASAVGFDLAVGPVWRRGPF